MYWFTVQLYSVYNSSATMNCCIKCICKLCFTLICWSAGFIFHIGIVLPLLLWIVHFAYITILVSCPIFGEQKLKKWSNRIHITFVPLVSLISVIGPIATASTVGYVTIDFPPTICFPNSIDAIFYLVALPDSVLLYAGVIMMILIVRKIHRVSVMTIMNF